MSIRCKFKIDSIARARSTGVKRDGEGRPVTDDRGFQIYEPCEMWSVKMSPVYGNGDPGHENTKFWAASPSGSFELSTVNKTAVESLDLGAEYYIDIVQAK